MERKFNFDRSEPFFPDLVKFETPTNHDLAKSMVLPCPGLMENPSPSVETVAFEISHELAASTGRPCYDAKTEIIAFPDEQKMSYWLKKWGFDK